MTRTRSKPILARLLAAAALLMVVGNFSMGQNEEFGPAKQYYDEFIKRPSLQMRTRGRVKLASTGHKGAFSILSESYAKAEDPKPQVKYLLTSICAKYFKDVEFDAGWTEWRNKHGKAEDAWLWYRSMILHAENGGEADLYLIANEHKDLFLKSAALEALCEVGSENLLGWWEAKLEDADDWKGDERTLLLEIGTKTLFKEAHSYGQDQFRKTALKLIPQIEHKKTDDRTKVIMARYFREIFGGDKLYVNAAPWLDRLLNPNKEVRADDKYAPATPPTKFVGVEAAGKRIVYVIDMSDSMLKPLSKEAKEKIKKPVKRPEGPVTGGGKSDKPDEEGEEEEEEEEDPLPWDKIKTRFDAAREYLKLSLRSLQDDQFYCVIWFGTEHETLKTTKGLTPVNKANVEKTCQELDRFKAGAPTQDRKDGVLKGNTNLHGGIRQAFKLTGKGEVKDYAYVNSETFYTGADTIFVLSDGDPTDDDWAIVDAREEWDQTGDPESRTRHADQPNLRFPGPYGYWQYQGQGEWIVDDVWRMNLFHKSEIHCIGIGEVSYGLLQGIARHGMGQVKMVSGN
ncbi:MAG: hypothetical protein K8I27_02415 [Planctomycetes bacterium]|nr:hypothetical protein [Planctomycetota bacterium]